MGSAISNVNNYTDMRGSPEISQDLAMEVLASWHKIAYHAAKSRLGYNLDTYIPLRIFEIYQISNNSVESGTLGNYLVFSSALTEIFSKRNIEYYELYGTSEALEPNVGSEIHVLEVGDYVLINDRLMITKMSLNLVSLGSRLAPCCYVCQRLFNRPREVHTHMQTPEHRENMARCLYLKEEPDNFIRQMNSNLLHCGVCNCTVVISEKNLHLASSSHKEAHDLAKEKAFEFVRIVQCSSYHLYKCAPHFPFLKHLYILYRNLIYIRPLTNSLVCILCRKDLPLTWNTVIMHTKSQEHKECLAIFNLDKEPSGLFGKVIADFGRFPSVFFSDKRTKNFFSNVCSTTILPRVYNVVNHFDVCPVKINPAEPNLPEIVEQPKIYLSGDAALENMFSNNFCWFCNVKVSEKKICRHKHCQGHESNFIAYQKLFTDHGCLLLDSASMEMHCSICQKDLVRNLLKIQKHFSQNHKLLSSIDCSSKDTNKLLASNEPVPTTNDKPNPNNPNLNILAITVCPENPDKETTNRCENKDDHAYMETTSSKEDTLDNELCISHAKENDSIGKTNELGGDKNNTDTRLNLDEYVMQASMHLQYKIAEFLYTDDTCNVSYGNSRLLYGPDSYIPLRKTNICEISNDYVESGTSGKYRAIDNTQTKIPSENNFEYYELYGKVEALESSGDVCARKETHILEIGEDVLINESLMITNMSMNFVSAGTVRAPCCLVCQLQLDGMRDIGEHVVMPEHSENMARCLYLREHPDDFIRQVDCTILHCGVCNCKVLTLRKDLHLMSPGHIEARDLAKYRAFKFVRMMQCSSYHLYKYAPDCPLLNKLNNLNKNFLHIRPMTNILVCAPCQRELPSTAFLTHTKSQEHKECVAVFDEKKKRHVLFREVTSDLRRFPSVFFTSESVKNDVHYGALAVASFLANKENHCITNGCKMCGMSSRRNQLTGGIEPLFTHLMAKLHLSNCMKLDTFLTDNYGSIGYIPKKNHFFCYICSKEILPGVDNIFNHVCCVKIKSAEANDAAIIEKPKVYLSSDAALEKMFSNKLCLFCNVKISRRYLNQHMNSKQHNLNYDAFEKLFMKNSFLLLDTAHRQMYCSVCQKDLDIDLPQIERHFCKNHKQINRIESHLNDTKNNFSNANKLLEAIKNISVKNETSDANKSNINIIPISAFPENTEIKTNNKCEKIDDFVKNEKLFIKEHTLDSEFTHAREHLYHFARPIRKPNEIIKYHKKSFCKFCKLDFLPKIKNNLVHSPNYKPKFTIKQIVDKTFNLSWKEDPSYYIDMTEFENRNLVDNCNPSSDIAVTKSNIDKCVDNNNIESNCVPSDKPCTAKALILNIDYKDETFLEANIPINQYSIAIVEEMEYISSGDNPYCVCCDVSLNCSKETHLISIDHSKRKKLLLHFLNRENIKLYSNSVSIMGFCEICDITHMRGSFRELINHAIDLNHYILNLRTSSDVEDNAVHYSKGSEDCEYCKIDIPFNVKNNLVHFPLYVSKYTIEEIIDKTFNIHWKEDSMYYTDITEFKDVSNTSETDIEKESKDSKLNAAEELNGEILPQNNISRSTKPKETKKDVSTWGSDIKCFFEQNFITLQACPLCLCCEKFFSKRKKAIEHAITKDHKNLLGLYKKFLDDANIYVTLNEYNYKEHCLSCDEIVNPPQMSHLKLHILSGKHKTNSSKNKNLTKQSASPAISGDDKLKQNEITVGEKKLKNIDSSDSIAQKLFSSIDNDVMTLMEDNNLSYFNLGKGTVLCPVCMFYIPISSVQLNDHINGIVHKTCLSCYENMNVNKSAKKQTKNSQKNAVKNENKPIVSMEIVNSQQSSELAKTKNDPGVLINDYKLLAEAEKYPLSKSANTEIAIKMDNNINNSYAKKERRPMSSVENEKQSKEFLPTTNDILQTKANNTNNLTKFSVELNKTTSSIVKNLPINENSTTSILSKVEKTKPTANIDNTNVYLEATEFSDKLKCLVCNINLFIVNIESHFNGRQHIKNLNGRNTSNAIEPSINDIPRTLKKIEAEQTKPITNKDKTNLEPSECGKINNKINKAENNGHTVSLEAHHSKVNLQFPEAKNIPSNSSKTKSENTKPATVADQMKAFIRPTKSINVFKCRLCEISVTSGNVVAHLNGVKHKTILMDRVSKLGDDFSKPDKLNPSSMVNKDAGKKLTKVSLELNKTTSSSVKNLPINENSTTTSILSKVEKTKPTTNKDNTNAYLQAAEFSDKLKCLVSIGNIESHFNGWQHSENANIIPNSSFITFVTKPQVALAEGASQIANQTKRVRFQRRRSKTVRDSPKAVSSPVFKTQPAINTHIFTCSLCDAQVYINNYTCHLKGARHKSNSAQFFKRHGTNVHKPEVVDFVNSQNYLDIVPDSLNIRCSLCIVDMPGTNYEIFHHILENHLNFIMKPILKN